MNVLLTCAGRRNYLVEYFRTALQGQGQIYAADSRADAPALQAADKAFVVPPINDKQYFDHILELCQRHQVRLLISLNDLELLPLARQRDRFLQVGTIPVISSPDVINICFDKWATLEFLKRSNLTFPKTYLTLAEAQNALSQGKINFPLVIKPRWGTASIGIEFPEDDEELALAYQLVKKKLKRTILAEVSSTDEARSILIQEKVQGVEYGLDIINDLEGGYVTTFVKRKISMRAGETNQAVTVENERLSKLGEVIGQRLNHVGNLDCDVFLTQEKCYVLELNPRFGGGYPFSHVAGADLPAMLVAWANGETPRLSLPIVKPNVTASKYDQLLVLKEIGYKGDKSVSIIQSQSRQAIEVKPSVQDLPQTERDGASPSIPMASPDITEAERRAVNEVLNSPILSIGPQIKAFEVAMQSTVGIEHALGVNSGTSGLHLCVIAADIEAGDTVITTPFSFIASANAILYEQAVPIFVDVDPKTGNIDPALVAEAANDLAKGGRAAKRWLPRTLKQSTAVHNLKAILPVHAFGQPADMDPILEVAKKHRLAIIEDACEALGAEYKGRQAGTLGDAAVFAFYPNKQMTTGEGGMIVTDNEEWANLFNSLRNQGRDIFDAWLNHTRLGYNYRLDEMSAALGVVQIQRIEELLANRTRVAQWYNDRLADLEMVERPFIAPETTRMSWFVYVIRILSPANRNEVMQELAKAGIPSRPYFTPIHLQPFYMQKFGFQRGDFPETERLGDISLALPFSGVMTEEQVEHVCSTLRHILLRNTSSPA